MWPHPTLRRSGGQGDSRRHGREGHAGHESHHHPRARIHHRAPLLRGDTDYRTMSQPVGLNFDPFGSFLNVELVMRVVGPSSMMAVTVK